jgi:hypothetical protein
MTKTTMVASEATRQPGLAHAVLDRLVAGGAIVARRIHRRGDHDRTSGRVVAGRQRRERIQDAVY